MALDVHRTAIARAEHKSALVMSVSPWSVALLRAGRICHDPHAVGQIHHPDPAPRSPRRCIGSHRPARCQFTADLLLAVLDRSRATSSESNGTLSELYVFPAPGACARIGLAQVSEGGFAMRIVALGSGGVGGFFGGLIAAAGTAGVAFVARGAHLQAMRRDGLTVERDGGRPPIDLPRPVVAEDPAE